MIEVQTAHTSQVDRTVLEAAQALLVDVFEGDLSEEDWEHALGGVHALVWEDGVLIGHGSVVQRRMLHGGRALRVGYVEGVGIRADRRGRGHGAAVMAALEEVLRGAYDLGVLSASDEAVDFYAGRGWQLWRGPLFALTPNGLVGTPEEAGSVFVLPPGGAGAASGAPAVDLGGALAADWRDGDVW
ncbi:GNAT family N-acetyltransferase [Kitasatospora sp. NPDC054939]